MKELEFIFKTDEDTEVFFKVVAHFLKKYFSHSESNSISLIEKYYAFKQQTGPIDWIDWMHHDGPYLATCHIEYSFSENHNVDFNEWLKINNHLNPPEEAGLYFLKIISEYQQKASED